MALKIECEEHLQKAREFAAKIGKTESLEKNIKLLDEWGKEFSFPMRCRLMSDFAPHSFYWILEREKSGVWEFYMNGGLIYHGPHDNGGDGGEPTLSVSLQPHHGWSIHT